MPDSVDRGGFFNDSQRVTLAGGALVIALLAFFALIAVVPGGGLLGTAGALELRVYASPGGSVSMSNLTGEQAPQTCQSPGPCTYSLPLGTRVSVAASP